jgi:hypothetical protein
VSDGTICLSSGMLAFPSNTLRDPLLPSVLLSRRVTGVTWHEGRDPRATHSFIPVRLGS